MIGKKNKLRKIIFNQIAVKFEINFQNQKEKKFKNILGIQMHVICG